MSSLYKYDDNGRLREATLPTGELIRLSSHLGNDESKRVSVSVNGEDSVKFDISEREI